MLPRDFHFAVSDGAKRLQCPTEYLAVAMMVSAGAVIGRKVLIAPLKYGDFCQPANLWGLLIGPPSSVKTPAISEGMRPLKRLEMKAKAAFREAGDKYQIELADYDLKREGLRKRAVKEIEKDSSLESAARSEFRNQKAPEKPVERRYKMNVATVEKVILVHQENPNGLLVHHDEVVPHLIVLERPEKAADRAFYLTAWSGTESHDYDTVGRGNAYIPAACISFLGTTQPAKIVPYLKKAQDLAGDDGMIARFSLMIWPDTHAWQHYDVDRRW